MIIAVKRKKNYTTKILLILFIATSSILYIKHLENKQIIKQEESLLLQKEIEKKEKEKYIKDFESFLLKEIEKIIFLLDVNNNVKKVRIVNNMIYLEIPKIAKTDFLKIRYGEDNVKIINRDMDNSIYIFINIKVFLEKDKIKEEPKKEKKN